MSEVPIAALPMYDWPDARAATDALWRGLRTALRAAGFTAPEALTRHMAYAETWTHPRLALGQTCGLPVVRELRGRVAVLGAPDYGLPGCAPGWYRSVVVVRGDDPRMTLEAFRGARLALNGTDSQSGYGSVLHHAAPLARDGRFFGEARITGAHARSAPLVAEGGADLAAIDAVTWRWLQRRDPATTARLRVLMWTDPTPGLPYISVPDGETDRRRAAVGEAIARLDTGTRDALGIRGFAPLEAQDYELIADRAAAAEARLSLPSA